MTVAEPRHGDVRIPPGEPDTTTTFGESGTTALTVSNRERYCRAHGWVRGDGVVGALIAIFEHDDCKEGGA